MATASENTASVSCRLLRDVPPLAEGPPGSQDDDEAADQRSPHPQLRARQGQGPDAGTGLPARRNLETDGKGCFDLVSTQNPVFFLRHNRGGQKALFLSARPF